MTQQTPAASVSRPTREAHPGGVHPGLVHPHLTGPGALRLPAVPWAAAVSRRYLRQLLRAWQLAAVTETAQLMASELVANAVTAARAPEGGVFLDERQPQSQPIELGVRRTGDSVIIEVTDPNPEPPVLRQADAMDEGGRGLSIIEILGSRWGYYPSADGGKVVWCEIAVTGTCAAGLLTLSTAGYPGVICARVPPGSEPVEPAPAPQPKRSAFWSGGRMCQHQPRCPDWLAPDRMAARIVADQPGQGWSLLCNGVILFDDGGGLLPDGQALRPVRPLLARLVTMAA